MIYNYQLSLVLCQQFRSPSLAEGSWQRKQARERSAFVASAFSPYFHSRYSQANRYRLVERLLYGFLDRQAIGYEELDSRGTGTHEGEIGA